MNTAEKQRTFTWKAPWLIGAMAFEEVQGADPEQGLRVAVASFCPEADNNSVQVLSLDQEQGKIRPGKALEGLPVPGVRVLFSPKEADVLVTVGDALRVWKLAGGGAAGGKVAKTLKEKQSEWSVPMTSADWNRDSTDLVAVGSMDTTVTVYDVQAGGAAYQVVASDREVTDVAWRDGQAFAATSADGSLRLWDLRCGGTSQQLYAWGAAHNGRSGALQSCGWCPGDSNLIAIVAQDTPCVTVLDVRRAGNVGVSVYADLVLPQGCCNAVAWAPTSPHIVTGGSDGALLLWDVTTGAADGEMTPVRRYSINSEINTAVWGRRWPRHIALAFGREAQILHI